MADNKSWNEIIRESINQSMYDGPSGDDDLSFVTAEDLRNVWKEKPAQFQELQDALGIRFSDEVQPFSDYIKVISIFVMMHARNWSEIGVLLMDGFRDDALPVSLHDLKSRWFASMAGRADTARDFHARQYPFCPIKIKQGRHVPCEDRHVRFPFVEESGLVGSGAFGTVTKVKIAKGYVLHKEDGEEVPSTKETIAARKKFGYAVHGRLEQGVLDRLRRESWQNDRIMPSFASVHLGSFLGECEFSLFFPFAPADLNKFLFEPYKSHQLLRVTPDKITPRALFLEAMSLIDALRYLHREDLRMCHSDLKLDNILIVLCDGHPIGKWKITDFGIASIEPRTASQAQGWGDVLSMNSIARMPINSSGRVTTNDRREKAPFQPPEVEEPELIPPGVSYRAKGDIWSMGCILVYVLVYALGGTPHVVKLRNIMHATTAIRKSDYQGYFYHLDSRNSATLYMEMYKLMESMTASWDRLAPTLSCSVWAQDLWSELILPMLTTDVALRTTAEAILHPGNQNLIQMRTPSQNIWDIWVPPSTNTGGSSQEDYRTDYLTRASGGMRTQSMPRPGGTRAQSPTNQLRPPGRSDRSRTPPAVDYQAAIRRNIPAQAANLSNLPIPEDVREAAESNSTSSGAPRSASVQSSLTPSISPLSFLSNSTEIDLKSVIAESPRAVQIAEDGARILFLTRTGVKSFSSSGSTTWSLGDTNQTEDSFNSSWHSFHLAGPFLYLRRQVTTLESNCCMRLHNFLSTTPHYQKEWDSSHINDLANMSLVTISSKGYIASRAMQTTILQVYDCHARLLLSWDLKKVDYPPSKPNLACIEAIGFDRSGEFLVVTAWNCWYMWDFNALNQDGKPKTYGHHSYTPPDTFNSNCSLLVLPGGRHFLLHDQSQHKHYICVDTQSGKVESLEWNSCPKPQTITISSACDWLAYIVENNSLRNSKDYLCYYQLRYGDAADNRRLALGPVQTFQFSKIKTLKVDRKPVVDSVVRIVSSGNNAYAVVASISGVVEMVPLRINQAQAPVKKKWWK